MAVCRYPLSRPWFVPARPHLVPPADEVDRPRRRGPRRAAPLEPLLLRRPAAGGQSRLRSLLPPAVADLAAQLSFRLPAAHPGALRHRRDRDVPAAALAGRAAP